VSSSSLSLRDISHSFGKRRALNAVSLEAAPGEIVALLGANGCGKSTLLRVAAGTLHPSKGSVSVCGPCGYVAQKFALYEDLGVEDNIRFFAQACGIARPDLDRAVENAVATFELAERRSQRAGELSQGWKQRLKLAVALVHNPPILLLDEASAGIDPISRTELWPILRDRANSGVAILLATHHMEEAEKCSRIVFLHEGSVIVSGAPADLREKAKEMLGGNPSLTEALTVLVGTPCR